MFDKIKSWFKKNNNSLSCNVYNKVDKLVKDDDGVLIKLYQIKAEGEYTIDCGQVYTQSQVLGTSDSEKHGTFSGLGNGAFWYDTKYTDKFASTEVEIQASDISEETPDISEETPGKSKIIEIRSDVTSITVQL